MITRKEFAMIFAYVNSLEVRINKAIEILEQENSHCPASLTLEKSYIIEVEKINKVLSILRGEDNEYVYDNGCYVLGEIINVKEYICKNADSLEEVKEIIDELENYDANDIVVIHYDNPMGYTIERFTKEDIMEV